LQQRCDAVARKNLNIRRLAAGLYQPWQTIAGCYKYCSAATRPSEQQILAENWEIEENNRLELQPSSQSSEQTIQRPIQLKRMNLAKV
jgi:hypothetical protein